MAAGSGARARRRRYTCNHNNTVRRRLREEKNAGATADMGAGGGRAFGWLANGKSKAQSNNKQTRYYKKRFRLTRSATATWARRRTWRVLLHLTRPEQRRPVHRDRVRQIAATRETAALIAAEPFREPRAAMPNLLEPPPASPAPRGLDPKIRREEQDQDGTRRDLGAEPARVVGYRRRRQEIRGGFELRGAAPRGGATARRQRQALSRRGPARTRRQCAPGRPESHTSPARARRPRSPGRPRRRTAGRLRAPSRRFRARGPRRRRVAGRARTRAGSARTRTASPRSARERTSATRERRELLRRAPAAQESAPRVCERRRRRRFVIDDDGDRRGVDGEEPLGRRRQRRRAETRDEPLCERRVDAHPRAAAAEREVPRPPGITGATRRDNAHHPILAERVPDNDLPTDPLAGLVFVSIVSARRLEHVPGRVRPVLRVVETVRPL